MGATITTTNYTYDKTGNRLQQTVNGSPVMTGTYNELDQLISDGTKQYTYDHRGNLTQITGGTKYKWDGADRLISATVGANTATYTYDDAGHRVKQTQGITTTNYLWDEESAYGDVVYESDGTNSTSYTLGGGELISQKRGSNSTEYFLMDGHSGVRNLVGTTTQNYNYDAFGNLQNFSGSLNTKYLYTGQQFDSLTGLYDLRARYYNPSQGRFLSRDNYKVNFNKLIELNRYSYSANNPINGLDPSGENFADVVGSYETARRESQRATDYKSGRSDEGGISEVEVQVAAINAAVYAQLGAVAFDFAAEAAHYVDSGTIKGAGVFFHDFAVAVGVIMDIRDGGLHVGVGITGFRQNRELYRVVMQQLVKQLPGYAVLINRDSVLPIVRGAGNFNNHAEDIVARWAVQNFNYRQYKVLTIAASIDNCDERDPEHPLWPSCIELFDPTSVVSYRTRYPELFRYTVFGYYNQ